MHSGPELAAARFDEPEIQALASAQQEEMRGIYGGEADIGPTRDAWMFEPPDGAFVVVRVDDVAVGCGGVCRFDGSRAELKRMYVAPRARGRGLGRRLLRELELGAAELGCRTVRLDTMAAMAEAGALYRSAGYEPIADYNGNPLAAVWMERALPGE